MKAYSYIRISSKGQVKGEGLKRQLDLAQDYADRHRLELDDSMRDVGSGYHGHHVRYGALGAFLEEVRNKRVPVGSVLICESLDRLSREDVLTAQAQLLTLLSAGIDVVTLIDGQRYSRDADYSQLIISLTVMARANEESKTKSHRAKARIDSRNQDIINGEKRYVKNIPSWIDQRQVGSSKDYTFHLNEHASTVQRIFEMYVAGIGALLIAQRLNEENVPPLKAHGKGIWRDGSVNMVLHSASAIGTITIGETEVPNYYPAAVDPILFWKVQDRFKVTSAALVGRQGKRYANLLKGILVCDRCGVKARMVIGKGQYRYVKCNTTLNAKSCDKKLFPYTELENAILDNISLFHLDPDNANRSGGTLAIDLQEIEGDLTDKNKRIANLREEIELADSADERAYYRGRIKELEFDRSIVLSRKDEVAGKLREIERGFADLNDINKQVQTERAKWAEMTNDEAFDSRARIANALKSFVSLVRVNFAEQEAYVCVGGMTMGWTFDRKGNVLSKFDLSHMPVERIQKIASNVGVETKAASIKKVWNAAADHREKVNSATDEIMQKIGAGKRI